MFAALRKTFGRLFASADSTEPAPPQVAPPAALIPPAAVPPSSVARPAEALAAEQPAQTVLTRSEVLDSKLAVRGYEFGLKAELRDKVRSHSRSVRDFMDGMLIDQLASVGDTIFFDADGDGMVTLAEIEAARAAHGGRHGKSARE